MAGFRLKVAEAALTIIGWPFRRPIIVRAINALSFRIRNVCVRLGRRFTERRLARGQPRAMWGVTPIVTLPLKARANGLLGIRAESVVWTTYVITQDFNWNLRWLAAIVQRLNPDLLMAFGRIVLALSLLRYDIYHLFNDRGLMWPTRHLGLEPDELDVLRLAGKRSYVFVYGADIRTREATLALGRWNFCTDCPEPGRFCICDDVRGAHQIAETAARVNAIVAMGDMVAYAPTARNLHYWPIDTDALAMLERPGSDGPLVVAHAPNHTHFKGTSYLELAIARLVEEGLDIVLSRVSGVPNTEVMRLFAEADVVADQFIGGAYGYTALEAMARGKPVLCYIRSLDMVMAAKECPILQARPETVYDVLKWCLANRDRLGAIGRQGRAYVEKHHSLQAVSGRFAALYAETGDFPSGLTERWRGFREIEASRQSTVPIVEGWEHPFMVRDVAASESRFNA
jgi:glycosyltransferase involved in cell wall biosynthesis